MKKTNYGNWVPENMLAYCFVAAAVLIIAALLTWIKLGNAVLTGILGVWGLISLVYAVYMFVCHELFAFGKGNMMAKVHENLVKNLDWNGEGKLLEIKTIRLIKRYDTHRQENTCRIA